MADALDELKSRLGDCQSLDALTSLLAWDQRTLMPPAGFQHRADHLSLLQRLSHGTLIDPEVGRLLDELPDAGPVGLELDVGVPGGDRLRPERQLDRVDHDQRHAGLAGCIQGHPVGIRVERHRQRGQDKDQQRPSPGAQEAIIGVKETHRVAP